LLNVVVGDVEDSPENGLSGGAANHEAINVWELDQLVGISLSDTATVDDTNNICLRGSNVLSDPATDVLGCFLRLVSTCNCASVESPEGLVHKHHIGPVLDVSGLEGFKLLREHLFVPLMFSIFLSLSKAIKNAEIAIFGLKDFLVDDLLRFFVELSTFRVADHDMLHGVVLDVICCNLTCVGTFAIGAAVLSTNHNAWGDNGLHE